MNVEQVNLINICLYGRGILLKDVFRIGINKKFLEYIEYLDEFFYPHSKLSYRRDLIILKIKDIEIKREIPNNYLLHLSCQCGTNNYQLRYFKIKTTLNSKGFIYIGSREYFDFIHKMSVINPWKCFDYKFEDKSKKPKKNFGAYKLNHEKANEIRNLYWEKNLTQAKIAGIYNVCRSTITNIINEKIYKNKFISGNSVVKVKYKY